MKKNEDTVILLVDDEPSLRGLIGIDFKQNGFQVIEANSGHESLDILKKSKVDIILSDVRMPNGDGLELLDKTKELFADLPVFIFITAYATLSLEEVYEKGVDAVFPKPFKRKALMDAVK